MSVSSISIQKAAIPYTYHAVRTLIPLLAEVEIVLNRLITTLGRTNGSEGDQHVKFTPSLLFDRKRWGFDRLVGAFAERFVENVAGFLETVGGDIVTIWTDEENGDVP